jgi:nucleoside-diphosphate-sugar epimerase
MSRVLLFGATGFIGRHVLPVLSADPRVSAVTCAGRDRVDLFAGDQEALTAFIAEEAPDAVVNCTGRLTGTGPELIEANTVATAKLIEAIAAARPGARFVRLGSAGEYGPVAHGQSVTEDHPAAPVSEYGISHLAGTQLVLAASAAGRIDGIALRVFNPIGAGLHADNLLGRCANLFAEARTSGARTITLGSLSAYRDFVDVRDVATAVLAAVVTPQLTARVCNIASGRAVTSRETVRLLAEAAGFTGEILERGVGPARSSAVGWMRGDIERARQVLGWSPAYELSESVQSIWSAVSPVVTV